VVLEKTATEVPWALRNRCARNADRAPRLSRRM